MEIENKRAQYDYEIIKRFEAGIVLTGMEVKAIKKGRLDLSQSYVKVINNELFLVNATINADTWTSNDSRKLLLHRKEIDFLNSEIKAKSLTIIPTKVYNKARTLKLEIALARSNKKYQKKDKKKSKDVQRDVERELRSDKRNHEIKSTKS